MVGVKLSREWLLNKPALPALCSTSFSCKVTSGGWGGGSSTLGVRRRRFEYLSEPLNPTLEDEEEAIGSLVTSHGGSETQMKIMSGTALLWSFGNVHSYDLFFSRRSSKLFSASPYPGDRS